MSNTDPFVTIRARTGNFNFADPSQTTTEVKVVIPAYDFDHTFSFNEDFIGYIDPDREPWNETLGEITAESPRLIGDREPQERLSEILSQHRAEIAEAWQEYRCEHLEQKIADLKAEKASLE